MILHTNSIKPIYAKFNNRVMDSLCNKVDCHTLDYIDSHIFEIVDANIFIV
jgi:hypothetical protein